MLTEKFPTGLLIIIAKRYKNVTEEWISEDAVSTA
jgi:hypothetical protein